MENVSLRHSAAWQPFLYCLITGLLIYAWELLPARKLLIVPQSEAFPHYVFSDNGVDGKPIGYWIDEAALSLVCDIPDDGKGHMCGFNVFLAPQNTAGINLTNYELINVFLHYQGGDPRLRFNIRNYEPEFSDLTNTQTSKFNNVQISTEYANAPLTLNLSEMFVAEWWITDYKVPREKSQPNFEHAQSFGVDLNYWASPGKHYLKLDRLEFIGHWISREHWYLGIMLMWILLILFYGSFRLIRLANQIRQERLQNNILAEESKKYKQLSTQDQLTGLLNRHGITEYIEQQHASEQMAMIVIDIDFFKRINDVYGHAIGDVVLKKVADIIRLHVGASAYAGRWGGEEFIVVLPGADILTAHQLAESLRMSIASERLDALNKEVVTISLGVGATSGQLPFHQLFRQVDLALYRAKAAGRNCTKIAEAAN